VAVAIVVRAGTCALGRAAVEDRRIDDAIAYVGSIACPWPERDGTLVDQVIPDAVAGEPRDAATTRFDRDLRAGGAADRARLVGALAARAEPHAQREQDRAPHTAALLGAPIEVFRAEHAVAEPVPATLAKVPVPITAPPKRVGVDPPNKPKPVGERKRDAT